MLPGSVEGLFDQRRRCVGEGGENAAGVQPAHPLPAKEFLPIKIPGGELRSGSMASIGDAEGAANAKTAFGEIEPVTHRAAYAIIRTPLDKRRINAALKNEIFDQTANVIVGQGRADGRAHAEAPAQTTRYVIFSAALPGAEVASRPHASFAGIQPQHDFPKGHQIILARIGRFNVQNRHGSFPARSTVQLQQNNFQAQHISAAHILRFQGRGRANAARSDEISFVLGNAKSCPPICRRAASAQIWLEPR